MPACLSANTSGSLSRGGGGRGGGGDDGWLGRTRDSGKGEGAEKREPWDRMREEEGEGEGGTLEGAADDKMAVGMGALCVRVASSFVCAFL